MRGSKVVKNRVDKKWGAWDWISFILFVGSIVACGISLIRFMVRAENAIGIIEDLDKRRKGNLSSSSFYIESERSEISGTVDIPNIIPDNPCRDWPSCVRKEIEI